MVRRILVLLGLVLILLPAFGGCGVTEEGGLEPDSGVGGSGNDGGGGVGGGQCFPGDKLCPDPKNPQETLCVKADVPANGCSASPACAPCAVPHATAACAGGQCAVGQCDPGWADCNNNPIDGCESDLNGDKNHCGNCATDCITSKGPGWICKAGVCEVNLCCPNGEPACATKDDCDGDKTNGCEVDKAVDPNNCKTCGNVCALANASSGCSQEVCVVTSCNGGWANCNQNDVDGCETNINSGNKANCGACGKACNETNASATCIGGTCVLACAAGWGNCDNNPDNGCETNLNTSPLHCSGCNKPCNPQNVNAAVCNNGVCDYTTCKNGYADCDNNRVNGCEINMLQNVNHCGGCGNVCQAPSGGTVLCSNGTCAQNCGSGLTNCGGVCVPLQTDINNCGNCSNKCIAPANGTATCNGTCGFNCLNGFHKCGNDCKSNTDATACGTSCMNCPPPPSGNGSPVCNSGSCSVNCNTGFHRCGADCKSNTDPTACGTTCVNCPGPSGGNGSPVCSSGTCGISCNSGFHLCTNQCKSNNDVGSCGTNCSPCPNPSAGTGTPTCDGTSCDISCSTPTPDKCGTACVDLQTSEQHCVTCGTNCAAGLTCCGTGNGCVDTKTDDNNCGSCGNKCKSNETCKNSACCPNGGPDGGADGGC